MTTKAVIYIAAPLVGLGLVGANIASAHGFGWGASPEDVAERHSAMLEAKAEILGVSVDEITEAWAEGTFHALVEDSGLTRKEMQEGMQAVRQEHMQERLQSLVDEGVITEEQAQERLEYTEEHRGKRGFGFGGKRHGGF